MYPPQIMFNRAAAICILLLFGMFVSHCQTVRAYLDTPTTVTIASSVVSHDTTPKLPDKAESLVECTGWIVYNLMIPTKEHHLYITPEEAHRISNEIIYWMLEYNIPLEDLNYVLSLYYSESKFDPLAKNSGSTASGIGQLLFTHWKGIDDPFEIEFNIAKSFELINATYANSTGDEYDRWMTVFLQYCGTRQGARNAMYNYNRFERLIEECRLTFV